MRQTLFRIWIEQPWSWWTKQAGEPPYWGACWVVIFLGLILFGYHWLRKDQEFLSDKVNWLIWGCAILGLSLSSMFGILPKWVPVYGYGAMMLIGFTTAMLYSSTRAKAVGHDPEVIFDAAVWVLIIGVMGGRIAYLIQYGKHVFKDADKPGEFLFAAVNLTEGGLVQIGGLLGGTLGFLLFCKIKKVDFFEFADIMAPAIFIGIGFGRLGCLLNGCCYGDRCDLPWAIEFPRESLTFGELVIKGFLNPAAAKTFPLHPTQIYSSINGFVLAFVTSCYFWYRQYRGDVFALACILYAFTRIQIEFLRADEMGQLGTGFTISQFYSAAILLTGIGIMLIVRKRSQPIHSQSTAATQTTQAAT